MGSPFPFLRMRNMFNPYEDQGITPDIPQGSMFPSPDMGPLQGYQGPNNDMSQRMDINQIMSSIYKPEHNMQDRLTGLLDTMPQRNNPGLLRKLGSAVIGIGQGPEAQEKALFAPYLHGMQDWKAKFDPTLQAANLERQGNINERQLAYQTASANIQQRRAKTQEEAEGRRQMKSEADISRDKAKNELAKWKAENPNGVMKDDKSDGFIHVIDPQTGDDIKTNVRHGDMSDLEKAQWRRGDITTKARLKEEGQSDNDAKNWRIIYQYDNQGNPTGTLQVNLVTGERKPITGPTKPPSTKPTEEPIIAKPGWSPTQDVKTTDQRVGEITNRNPDWKKWIKKDPNTGEWSVTPSGKTFGYNTGPDEQTRQMILKELYPNQNQGVNNPNTPPPNARPGGTWRTTRSGARVYVEP